MCHRYLDVPLCQQINFITGNNGSKLRPSVASQSEQTAHRRQERDFDGHNFRFRRQGGLNGALASSEPSAAQTEPRACLHRIALQVRRTSSDPAQGIRLT